MTNLEEPKEFPGQHTAEGKRIMQEATTEGQRLVLLDACEESLRLLTARLDLADITDEEKYHRSNLITILSIIKG